MEQIFAIVLVILNCLTIVKCNTRIIGGVEAIPNSAPFIVSFQKNGSHFCGGSIINDFFIVTAGHCLFLPESSFIVVAGGHNINKKESTIQERNIATYKIHENYSKGVGPYDIGVVKISKPFDFNKFVKRIQIDLLKTPKGISTLYGWGKTQAYSSSTSNSLQTAELPILSLGDCSRAISSVYPYNKGNICTGPLTGGRSGCNGDSGGPLVQNENNEYKLIGIVSWGFLPCGKPASPTIYTYVPFFQDWVKNTVCSLKEDSSSIDCV